VRFLKLALAVIVAVNGIFLTSAGRADADPAPCDDCVTSPASGIAAHSGSPITVGGYVHLGFAPGSVASINIEAFDLDTAKFETVGTVTSTTGLCTEWNSVPGRFVPACPWSWTGVIPLKYWAPRSIKDTNGMPVSDVATSQGHLVIQAYLDLGPGPRGRESLTFLGQTTVFDPYGVPSYNPGRFCRFPCPDYAWVPDAGMISQPRPGFSGSPVAWSVGHYIVAGGKTTYALICAPTTDRPNPVVIYNHGGLTGIFGSVARDGWASPPPLTYDYDPLSRTYGQYAVGATDDLGMCLDWANRGWVFAESAYRGEGLNITSQDQQVFPGAAAAPACYGANVNHPLWQAGCNTWLQENVPGELCLGEVTDVMALTDLLVKYASSITVGPVGPGQVHINPKYDPSGQLQLFMYGYSHGGCITYRAVEQGAPVKAFSVIEGITDTSLGYLDCLGVKGNTPQAKADCATDAHAFTPSGGYYLPDANPGVMGYNWRSPHYFAAGPWLVGDLSGPRFATMPILIFHGDIDWEQNPVLGYNPTPLEQAAEIANDIGYSANSGRAFSSTTNYFVGPSNVTSKQCPRGNALTPATARKHDCIPTETACLAGPAGAPIPDATTVLNATCPISFTPAPQPNGKDDLCFTNTIPNTTIPGFCDDLNLLADTNRIPHYFVVYHNVDHVNGGFAIYLTLAGFVSHIFGLPPGCDFPVGCRDN
jgi:hypothetical protein